MPYISREVTTNISILKNTSKAMVQLEQLFHQSINQSTNYNKGINQLSLYWRGFQITVKKPIRVIASNKSKYEQ